MPEGSHPCRLKSGPASHKRHPAIHLPDTRVGDIRSLHHGELAPVASGGELGHAPLEPSSVLAEPVGCACRNEPAHELRPVGSEPQGERATCRDAEHVERPAELVFDRGRSRWRGRSSGSAQESGRGARLALLLQFLCLTLDPCPHLSEGGDPTTWLTVLHSGSCAEELSPKLAPPWVW